MPTPMRRPFILAAALAALCIGGCAHRRPAEARPDLRAGTLEEVGPHLSNYSEATIPRNGSIIVRSDDFTGSAAPATKLKIPAPKKTRPVVTISLADALAQATGLTVVDQSRPAETLAAAAERLKGAPIGNLVVICYGFGDATATAPTKDFRASLIAMIRAAHTGGAAVYLVVEPATTLPASAKVEPYREVFRTVAASEGAGLIDSPALLLKATQGPSKTAVQPKAAVEIIAGTVAAYIKVAPPV